jgi:HD superfamily phosphohydrolase
MISKIINDPVYGFIQIKHQEILDLISHPLVQRLRRIKQMGIAHYVYPGAVHTRFHHSLGASYLMRQALENLKEKGIEITETEMVAAQQAILLHDIGHGPFSHALEHAIIDDISHESISNILMNKINEETNGSLTDAIAIFNHEYPKIFLHQLVSSQLDMDRMDYLNRDSFYTGVSEGVIGYDRILQMLTVVNDQLCIEEKGIHSVEKFIIARRMMYWQVYLHKTVLGVEQLIVKILKRAKYLAMKGEELFAPPAFRFFLYEKVTGNDFSNNDEIINKFASLDDSDISCAIKVWANHKDKVLSILCNMILKRRLYKVKMSSNNLDEEFATLQQEYAYPEGINEEEKDYFLFKGSTTNKTYNQYDELITVKLKSGKIINITEVDNALINPFVTLPVKKHYIIKAPSII